MTEAKGKEAIYIEIPERTWNWLGVNTATVPEEILSSIAPEKIITVPDGESAAMTIVYRDEPNAKIRAELGEGATLDLVKVQLAGDDVTRADRVAVNCAKDATIRYTAVELGAKKTATKLNIELIGDKSKADVAALFFGTKDQVIDMNYVIRHRGKNTDATMMVDGTLDDHAEKIFRGTLDFVRGTEGSVGREKEQVILLSHDVRNRSVPLMLSGEADVDGHHAVSIGKMDESKLFYLMSRGLDEAEAKKLVTMAAAAPVLARIKNEKVTEEIENIIEGRLS